ncbi:hypothetical protein HDU67_008865 [Dinochytrium kinnereticum]|nr:hypothetical protein HDU67_008865 [Dinochytrium kinnereticum]
MPQKWSKLPTASTPPTKQPWSALVRIGLAVSAVLIVSLYLLGVNSSKHTLKIGPVSHTWNATTSTALRIAFFTSAFGEDELDLVADQFGAHAELFCPDRPWFAVDHFVFADPVDAAPGRVKITALKEKVEGTFNPGNVVIVAKDVVSKDLTAKERSKVVSEKIYQWMDKVLEEDGKKYQYVYWQSPESKFIRKQCEDIFGKLVAVYHPDYIGQKGPFEENEKSSAFVQVPSREIHPYLTSTLFGGKSADFRRLLHGVKTLIEADKSKKIESERGGEAYLNAYLHNVQIPHVVLSRGFATKRSSAMDVDKSPRMAELSL